jgi:hypothetical protein
MLNVVLRKGFAGFGFEAKALRLCHHPLAAIPYKLEPATNGKKDYSAALTCIDWRKIG